MDLKLISEKNNNTNNYHSNFNGINLKEPEIQPPPTTIAKSLNLNAINYDEFSNKENYQNKNKTKEKNINLNNNKINNNEINDILNLNNKINDLKQINYNFNYNNYNYTKANNIKEINNSNNNIKKSKETIDLNEIGKIIAKDINNGD